MFLLGQHPNDPQKIATLLSQPIAGEIAP